jgi:hypothetical protein
MWGFRRGWGRPWGGRQVRDGRVPEGVPCRWGKGHGAAFMPFGRGADLRQRAGELAGAARKGCVMPWGNRGAGRPCGRREPLAQRGIAGWDGFACCASS